MRKMKCYSLQNIIQKRDLFFVLLFLLVACFVFWKCRFGLGSNDEYFYLTIPYRLLQGDALFQQEWHLSQMSGVLTMPIVAAVLALKGSTEGILLAMRYVCTAMQCAVTLFLYLRLRKQNWLGATAAAICFLLYTPFGIMALSYNSMGILCLSISLIIVLTAERKKSFQYFVAGLFYAAAVLCCPYLALVYFGYLVVVTIGWIMHRSAISGEYSLWNVKGAMYITAGAAMAAVIFTAFVLSRSTVEAIIQSFEPMMNDPEHLIVSVSEKGRSYFDSVFRANKYTPYLYTLLAVLWLICLLDKYRRKHKAEYFCAAFILISCLHFSHYFVYRFINMLMWAINFYGFFIILLSENPKIIRVFKTICIPGLLYSCCMHWSSNTGFLAISSGATVASVGSLLMVGMFFDELRDSTKVVSLRNIAASIAVVILVLQIGSQAVLRYEYLFMDEDISQMNTQILDGVEKGIVTTDIRYQEYYSCLEELENLTDYPARQVLYLSENTWYYLQSEKEMSAYSAWLSGVNLHTLDRLEVFYENNPYKLPDIVYVEGQYPEIAEDFCRRFQYLLKSSGEGFLLYPMSSDTAAISG